MKTVLYTLFIALLATFAMPSAMMAADGETIDVQYLVIQQNDGTEDKFALTDYPEITFSQDTLVVTTADRVFEVALADFDSYSIATVKEDSSTSIGSVQQSAPAAPAFSYGKAEFSGLKSGTTVTACNINGQVVATIVADADGIAKLNMSALPKGVIILRAPGKSIKLINK